MGWISTVGYSALGVLVVGWLVVSFSAPGPRRTLLEWISATALFAALASLFANLWLGAEGLLGTLGFGFLLVLFGCGLAVSTAQTLLSLRGEPKGQASATH
jgi:hypothetical protein